MRHFISPWTLAALGAFGSAASGAETEHSHAQIETVVVTGHESGLAAEVARVSRIPGGASVVDLDAIGGRTPSNLADALRYVPGVWSASHAGNDGIFFSSRGSNLDATDWDMNGIKLLQDGLPVTTADGNNHNRVVDPLAAHYMTVARGANALEYGASTLGGAIDLVTPTGRDHPGVDVAANAGSHGFALGRFSYGVDVGDRFDAFVTIEAKTNDGYRRHGSEDRAGIHANAGIRISDRLTTRFYLPALDVDQELPGALTRAELDADPKRANAAAVAGHYQRNVEALRFASKTHWTIDARRALELGVSYEEQSLFHPIVWVEVGGIEMFSLLIDTDHRNLGTTVRFTQDVGRHSLLLGLNHARSDVAGGNFRNLAGRPNGLREHVDQFAETTEVFAVDRVRLGDDVTLVLGAQAAWAERDVQTIAAGTGDVRRPRARYERISPRVGVLKGLGNGATLYGNLSRLFEPPTNYELEDNAAGGDATLDAMTGTVVEIGARRAAGADAPLLWDVSLYYAEIDDEILAVEDPAAPGTSLVTNVERTIHAGLEAVVGASLPIGSGALIEPTLSVTINEFRFDGDSTYGRNELPAAPKYFARGELLYRSPAGWYLGPTLDVVGERWADFANRYRIESHVLTGLRGGWTGQRWEIFGELRNLADRTYVATHSVRAAASPNDAILNPGEPRSAYVGFRARLD